MTITRAVSIAQKEYLVWWNQIEHIMLEKKRQLDPKSTAAPKGQWSLAATTLTVQTASA